MNTIELALTHKIATTVNDQLGKNMDFLLWILLYSSVPKEIRFSLKQWEHNEFST